MSQQHEERQSKGALSHVAPEAFAPHTGLAAHVIPFLDTSDGAHDLAHLLRVWHNAQRIAAVEGGESDVLAAAVLLHDCVALDKTSPLRPRASALAAEQAGTILSELGWNEDQIAAVQHAVAAHSFSAGIVPMTLEARVVQDADRLDAIGHIGIARCFYTAGRLGSALYQVDDVSSEHRVLDDSRYALDHFRSKLLRLGENFQTATASRMAAERIRVVAAFLAGFEAELKFKDC
jgi:uncharacterized protein